MERLSLEFRVSVELSVDRASTYPNPLLVGGGYTRQMQPKLSRSAVILVLAICLVCPLVEMFDHWEGAGCSIKWTTLYFAPCPIEKSSPRSEPQIAEVHPTREEIELRAHQIYVESGGAHGQDLEEWLQAERELLEKYGKTGLKAKAAV